MTEYYAGKGCTCAPWRRYCCCGMDWADPEIYRMQAKIDALEALIKAMVEDLRMRAPWDEGEAELVVDLSDSIYRKLKEVNG